MSYVGWFSQYPTAKNYDSIVNNLQQQINNINNGMNGIRNDLDTLRNSGLKIDGPHHVGNWTRSSRGLDRTYTSGNKPEYVTFTSSSVIKVIYNNCEYTNAERHWMTSGGQFSDDTDNHYIGETLAILMKPNTTLSFNLPQDGDADVYKYILG